MSALELNPKTTALVLIDLQNAIMERQLAPHSSVDVMARCAKLATTLRALGGLVVYVHVDMADMLSLPVDVSTRDPNAPPPPPAASEFAPASGYQSSDRVVTKRSWGAFFGTDLEQQLRRREIRTVIMGGVSTNIGVESTAREAFDRGYQLIFAEDAMSTMKAEMQAFALQYIFPRMGRVRSTEEVLKALAQ